MAKDVETSPMTLNDSKLTRTLIRSSAILLTVTGIVLSVLAINLGLGTLDQPGPGLWPLITSTLLVLSGVAGLFYDSPKDYERWNTRSILIVAGIVVLALYIPLVLLLGFLFTSFALMLVWLHFFANEKWIISFGLAILGAVSFYVIFDVLLGVPLPRGFWNG